MCGLGSDKQIVSSYTCNEIMLFYARTIVFTMFYLFYVSIGYNSFNIHFRQSFKALSEHDYTHHFKVIYMSTFFFVSILYCNFIICFTEDHMVDWIV